MQGEELRRVLGQNVAARRREKELTQEQLAAKAGIAQAFVAQIEGAARFPRSDALAAIAEALGTSPSALLSTDGIFSEIP